MLRGRRTGRLARMRLSLDVRREAFNDLQKSRRAAARDACETESSISWAPPIDAIRSLDKARKAGEVGSSVDEQAVESWFLCRHTNHKKQRGMRTEKRQTRTGVGSEHGWNEIDCRCELQ